MHCDLVTWGYVYKLSSPSWPRRVVYVCQCHRHRPTADTRSAIQTKQSKICCWMKKILYWIDITIIIITVIKLFVKCKIFSVETILTHARSHAHEHASEHTSILTIQNLIYAQLETGSKQRLEMDEDSNTERKTWLYLWEKKCYRFDEWVQRGCQSERKGTVSPCRGTKDRHHQRGLLHQSLSATAAAAE